MTEAIESSLVETRPTLRAPEWTFKAFDALSTPELYAVLQLRSAVFVVEQTCVFQDMDGFDEQALHLMGWEGGELVAYARCFAAGVKFDETSIGRVISHPGRRGNGLGHQLMAEALRCVVCRWGAQAIRIGAQAHLRDFYAQHGFVDVGRPYLEDGIAHLEMLRQP